MALAILIPVEGGAGGATPPAKNKAAKPPTTHALGEVGGLLAGLPSVAPASFCHARRPVAALRAA